MLCTELLSFLCLCLAHGLEQISSVRDISRSNMAESSGSSNNRRLLRLKLTDGHSEITAIEYSHIPSIPDDVVPGTKVLPFSMTIW